MTILLLTWVDETEGQQEIYRSENSVWNVYHTLKKLPFNTAFHVYSRGTELDLESGKPLWESQVLEKL